MSPDPCVVFLLANSDLARRLLCFARSKGSYKWLQVEITLVDLTAEKVIFSYGRVEYSCSQGGHAQLSERGPVFVREASTAISKMYQPYLASRMSSTGPSTWRV